MMHCVDRMEEKLVEPQEEDQPVDNWGLLPRPINNHSLRAQVEAISNLASSNNGSE